MYQLSPVDFHDDTIFCIEYQEQPFTPMRPIVENLGLGWASQSQKLNSYKDRWGVTIIVTPSEGGEQQMLCLPLRKLPAWFASLNPKKVREELRSKIELYQNECDDALWNYWMNGRAERKTQPAPSENPDAPITPADQNTLQAIVRARVEAVKPASQAQARGLYGGVWSRFNNHFRLGSYRQLPQGRMAEAVAYLVAMPVGHAGAVEAKELSAPRQPLYRDGCFHLPPVNKERVAGPREKALRELWQNWSMRDQEIRAAFDRLVREIDELRGRCLQSCHFRPWPQRGFMLQH